MIPSWPGASDRCPRVGPAFKTLSELLAPPEYAKFIALGMGVVAATGRDTSRCVYLSVERASNSSCGGV